MGDKYPIILYKFIPIIHIKTTKKNSVIFHEPVHEKLSHLVNPWSYGPPSTPHITQNTLSYAMHDKQSSTRVNLNEIFYIHFITYILHKIQV